MVCDLPCRSPSSEPGMTLRIERVKGRVRLSGEFRVESAGVSVLHCLAYIREWMLQERGQPKDHPEPR